MNKELSSALVILVIAVSAGTGYFFGVSHQSTTTSISITTQFSTTTATTLSIAQFPTLQLIAAVSPKVVPEGRNVSIVAGVYNPLPRNVTVTGAEISNPSQGPCGLGIAPMGIRVYQGRYAFANISEAKPLLLYNASGPPPCAAPLSFIDYVFLPNSDTAGVVSFMSGSWEANETFALGGFFSNCADMHCDYQKFSPGVYTVLIFDTWEQQALEYFYVSPQLQQSNAG
jgi:hypothetical protein